MEKAAESPLRKFLRLNERNLFWLFVASALIFIANWFLATHGVVEFESDRLRQLLKAVSAFTPVIGILLGRLPERHTHCCCHGICLHVAHMAGGDAHLFYYSSILLEQS